MFDDLKDVLALIGAFVMVAAGLTIIFIVVLKIYDSIRDYRETKMYEYKIAHRFDGPPLAKCYCIDCRHCYGEPTSSGCGVYCSLFRRGMVIQDNSFCYRADPKKKEDIRNDCEKIRDQN